MWLMKIGKLQLFVEVRAKQHTLRVVIGSTVLNTRLCTERNDAFDLCHFIVCISFTFFALCCTEWNWEGICDCDDEMFFLGVGRIRVGVFNSSVCSEWVKNRENNGTKVTEVVLVVAGSSTTC